MLGIIVYCVAMLLLIGLVIWSVRRSPKTRYARDQAMMRCLSVALIILLVVQFFVGLAVNLWITLPKSHPGSEARDYFIGVNRGVSWALVQSDIVLLVVHIIIALLLIAGVAGCLTVAMIKKERFWIQVFGWSAVCILAAFFNGASFLNYGHQVSSLLMEVFFVLALSSQLVALYITKPLPGSRT